MTSKIALFLAALSMTSLIAPLHAADPVEPPTDPAKFELYLLVGQSNMAGRGKITPADQQPDPNVLVLDAKEQWANQGEPIHFDKKEAGVGLGFTFAKLMAKKKPGVTIGLIPCAVGGTPISRWQPGGDLFENAVRRAKIAQQKGVIKGILWHQGESESGNADRAKAYAQNLANTLNGFRTQLNIPDAPIVVGELGEFLYVRSGHKSPYAKVVNEQIDSIPTLVPNSAVAASKDLVHKGDELHFDAASQKEFGKRYFEAFCKLTDKQP